MKNKHLVLRNAQKIPKQNRQGEQEQSYKNTFTCYARVLQLPQANIDVGVNRFFVEDACVYQRGTVHGVTRRINIKKGVRWIEVAAGISRKSDAHGRNPPAISENLPLPTFCAVRASICCLRLVAVRTRNLSTH